MSIDKINQVNILNLPHVNKMVNPIQLLSFLKKTFSFIYSSLAVQIRKESKKMPIASNFKLVMANGSLRKSEDFFFVWWDT